jgi:hypothetical protein
LELIAGGVVSLLVGVITWWITHTRARLDEKRRMKRELLMELVGNRYDLTGDAFSRALNATGVVFADSTAVKEAVRSFHDKVTSDSSEENRQRSLLLIVRRMFEDLGLEHGDLSDEFLLRPFNTRAGSIEPRR